LADKLKLKVTFKRVFVKKSSDWFGSGEFYFIASVDGKTVGDKSHIFDAREGAWIDLPAAKWSAEVDVTTKAQVVVRFNGKDQDTFFDEDLGSLAYAHKPAWKQGLYHGDTEYFRLEYTVELLVDGKYGQHAPDAVFACRATNGNGACTTVSGVPIVARIEVHPVRPVPAAVPPRGLPAGQPVAAVENKGGTVVNPTDPINVIPNPSVIPILSAPGGAAPAAGAPPVADKTNCARIEVTFYRPDTLKFTDTDPRLVWSVRPIAGGAVSFLGAPNGLKVWVYGTAAGEVALELRFRGELMATYRVLVMKVKQVPCRFNILNGPTANSKPRSTPADILNHLAITNRYMRQIALELVLDTNPSHKDGAVPTTTPGIFRISVAKGVTRNANSGVADFKATRLNYRPGVMNFAYTHSDSGGALGAATDIPASKVAPAAPGARPRISDSGTPSTSWIPPTGVAPDGAAGTVNMDLIAPIQRHGHPKLFAMFVCDSNGDPTTAAGMQNYANTISHEFGHILNLGHRVEGPNAAGTGLVAGGIFFDGLTIPLTENIMHWNGPATLCQDFDIIQARAVHQSPLVPP